MLLTVVTTLLNGGLQPINLKLT